MENPIFELTNHRRACLGLTPVEPHWVRIPLTPSPSDTEASFAYTEGTRVRKLIRVSEVSYQEYTLDETLSEDGAYILPKTAKGKPVKLTAAALSKKPPVGMALSWQRNYLSVYNSTSQQGYYRSSVDEPTLNLQTIADFRAWLDKWCAETTEADMADAAAFAARERVHRKFCEGDFFRVRLDRRHWAYGRILLDFAAMRKKKIEFWDVFFGKPLVIGVYRILTENPMDDIGLLAGKPMLPSQLIMDNLFYYGEAEIIGNRPLTTEEEDFPINYGMSKRSGEDVLYLQCGRLFRKIEGGRELPEPRENCGLGFFFGGIGWEIEARIPILEACIREGSNKPYWEQPRWAKNLSDLRNPRFQSHREAVFAQFGLDAADYVRDSRREEVPAKKSFFGQFKKK